MARAARAGASQDRSRGRRRAATVGDLRLDPAAAERCGAATRRSRSRRRSSRSSRRSCDGPARCSRGSQLLEQRLGLPSTRTARTWSTPTCASCARRSTGRFGSDSPRDGARRRLSAARGRRRVKRIPIRLRVTLVVRRGDGHRARRQRTLPLLLRLEAPTPSRGHRPALSGRRGGRLAEEMRGDTTAIGEAR